MSLPLAPRKRTALGRLITSDIWYFAGTSQTYLEPGAGAPCGTAGRRLWNLHSAGGADKMYWERVEDFVLLHPAAGGGGVGAAA